MELPEQEFEAVYRAYASLVFRYLWCLGCPPQDAEDIVQDTFVTALLHIDSWRGEGSLSAWLTAIARNTALNRRRANRAQKRGPLPDLPLAELRVNKADLEDVFLKLAESEETENPENKEEEA